MNTNKRTAMMIRWLLYCVGMLLLAVGLTMNTKIGLGVSPIISVAYVFSQILDMSFGDTTLALYCLFIVIQLFLHTRDRWPTDLLQIVVSVIFSRVLNLFEVWIPYDGANHSLAVNLLLLAIGIVITGVGVSLTVNMRLAPNPGDGIVHALAEKVGKEQGVMKNIFDVGCVAISVTIGMVAAGELVGVGIGTIIAMIGIGRVISLTNRLAKQKMCDLAGIAA